MPDPSCRYADCFPACAVCAESLRGRDFVLFEGAWMVQHQTHQRVTASGTQLYCCVECVGNYFEGSLIALKHELSCSDSGDSPEL